VILAILMIAPGCAMYRLKRTLVEPSRASSIDPKSRHLKAHMKDGSAYVLTSWMISPPDSLVRGEGRLLDPNRNVVAEGTFDVPLDSVVLFESNVVQTAPEFASLTIVTGLSLALTAYCIANPKACFGSCPTFYVSDPTGPTLRAEGFSSSVAPCLEATDRDALYRTAGSGKRFTIEMRNEALETHVVRHADLLAVPRPGSARVITFPDGSFHPVDSLAAPVAARGSEGSVTELLAAFDGDERWSPADSSDLAAREEIELRFAPPRADSLCLVIAARQSLLSTYVFYQSLAWMGSEAAAWLARLERGGDGFRSRVRAPADLLGGIEVLVPDSAGTWQVAGSFQETGPLAADVKAIPLPPECGTTVRLRLSRGHWRLDRVALGRLGPALAPVRLHPARVDRNGCQDPSALLALIDPEKVLVTLPGDTLRLAYDLPEGGSDYELFLESRGYYLEWIRQEWIDEESPVQAARLFLDPSGALRALAPAFKKAEPGVEDVFWNSRFARP
jgi:hypothetical protein